MGGRGEREIDTVLGVIVHCYWLVRKKGLITGVSVGHKPGYTSRLIGL